MLRLIVSLSLMGAVSSCALGPGVRCQSDGDCQGWGRCEVVSGVGYCVESGEEQAPPEGTAAIPAPPASSDVDPCANSLCTSSTVDAPPSQTPPANDSGTAPALETDGGFASVSPTQLNFGLVSCGTRASAQTVVLTNASRNALTLIYALDPASAPRFRVSGPATVDIGGSAAITVTPEPIPAVASTAPDAFGGTLTISASSRTQSASYPVALHQTAQGAVFALSPSALAFTAGWGKTQVKPFILSNSGNLTAPFVLVVSGADAINFSATPTSGQVGAAANVNGQLTFTAPLLGTKDRFATLGVTTTAPVCGPLPSIALSGKVK
jgi:hypothetical protein